MFRRMGSTVAVCVGLVASGVLLGQALSPDDEAQAQLPDGESVGKFVDSPALAKDLRILRERLANIRNRKSALFYLREIDQQTQEICVLLAAPSRPPQCF